jgi:hypothetical protein
MKAILPVLVLISSVVVAQNFVTGTVTDQSTNQAIEGAHVFLKKAQKGTVTNSEGNFAFTTNSTAQDTLEISFIGYSSALLPIEIANGKTKSINIALSPGSLQLADATITAFADNPFNVVSQADLSLRPSNSSQDILRMVPGLFIAQHAGGGKAEQIFLRGFDIDHGTDIQLSVDGLPVNMVSHAHGQGYSDLHFLIPEVISLVDFGKGPYAADKSNFATAGYVAFQSKNILDKNFVKLEAGQFGTTRAVAGVNIDTKGYFASEVFRSNGYFESPQDFNRFNASAKYKISMGAQSHLLLASSFFASQWNASGQVPVRVVNEGVISRFGAIDDTEGGSTSRFNLHTKLVSQLSPVSSLEQQAYAIQYDFDLYSNFTFFLHDPVNGDQIRQQESRMIYGYQGVFNHAGTVAGKEIKTEAGMEVRYDLVDDIALSSTVRRAHLANKQLGDIREGNINAYLNGTLLLNDRWSVNGAARFDFFSFYYRNKLVNQNNSATASIVSPKLSVNYQLNDEIQFYIKSGYGFHSNDARTIATQRISQILPRAFGADVGFNAKLFNKSLLHLAFWSLLLDQEFVYVGDEGIVEPNGETLRRGIDLSIRHQVLPWLFIDADMNFTRPQAKGKPRGEHYIPLAPTLTAMGGLTVQLSNGWNGSVRYRYLGDRAANETNSVVADGYFLADVMVAYTKKKYEIGLSVENFLNTNWREAQFDTESRLFNEAEPVSEIHFTPGAPFFAKLKFALFFQ